MKKIRFKSCNSWFKVLLVRFILFSESTSAQAQLSSSTDTLIKSPSFEVVKAGEQYNTSTFHQWLWGKHYRKEWDTPVKIRYIDLDSAGGGLTPTRLGGGRQSTTLHLIGENDKQYVFRSIDKTYTGALPEEFHGTFIEKVINDQVSSAHPYAAITIPPMISAAGLYHTKPEIVLVPDHKRLGKYRKQFAGMLVLFEERADEDQSDADHFGNTKNAVGTTKMMEKVFGNNDHLVDQKWYTKTRLFDIFIGDWGRHEDQWRWATFNKHGQRFYRPIPRDRDQVYTLFDGKLLSVGLSLSNLHMESFEATVKDIAYYNFPARNLDRRFTNEITKEEWLQFSNELQQALTDSVIEAGVRQLPPEVFPISGEEIITKLKSRRDILPKMANDYYHSLAKEVEITGTNQTEYFHIHIINPNEVAVNVYGINKKDEIKQDPIYSRRFNAAETKEIRLYGLDGDDVFVAEGNSKNRIIIRIIGGEGKDSVKSISRNKIHVYDTENSRIKSSPLLKVRISNDTLQNSYRYDKFKYDKGSITFKPGTTVGLGYASRKHKWNKEPFSSEHSIMLEYMLYRSGIGVVYRGSLNEIIGKNNLSLLARFDFPYIDNFFGLGNESEISSDVRNNRIRTNEVTVGVGLNRFIDSHFLQLQPFYQTIKMRYNENQITSTPDIELEDVERKHFGGVELMYNYQRKDHPVITSKGFDITASASYTQNLQQPERSFNRYTSSFSLYLPISGKVSFASRIGGATLTGEPEFYQWNVLGGGSNLRGYVRQRFFGKTSFYNNNEIRWLTDTRNQIFNGKIGLLAFTDQGRIWHNGENSNKWHLGYGAGLLIAPFEKILFNGTLGYSEDFSVFHFRVGYFF